MSIISWLSATPKVVDTAADVISTGMKGIDALFYTDEEKAGARKELYDQWLRAQEVLQKESSVRSMTRRALSLSVMFSYLAMLLTAIPVGFFNREYAMFILSVAGILTPLALGIGAFFWGSHLVRASKE